MPRRLHIERDAAISRAIAAGQSVRSIAADFGLAVSTVYGIARREGWTWHLGPRQDVRFCARDGCSRRLPRTRNRFCSFDCFVASLRSGMPTCPQCGGRVKRRSAKFCSRGCYGRWLHSFWGEIHASRDSRIRTEARSGRPLARIAASHGVSHRTVAKIVRAPHEEHAGICEAPGCSAPLPRRRRRFCSAACRRAAHDEAGKPLCANGCGARARRRSGQFCGRLCQADFAARRARESNGARDVWIHLASVLRIPQAEIASRTGLSRKYVSVLVRRQRRLLLPAPLHVPGRFAEGPAKPASPPMALFRLSGPEGGEGVFGAIAARARPTGSRCHDPNYRRQR